MSSKKFHILQKALKSYNVFITNSTIEKDILTHPDYPSIKSLSDALDRWKIKHVVMKLSLEKLHVLDVPVLSQFKKEESIWITKVSETDVHYWDASNKKKIVKRDNFEKKWSGVALAIIDVSNAGDSDYRKQRLNELLEKLIIYSISGSCLVLLTLLTFLSWKNDNSLTLFPKFMLLLVNASGCFLSFILIRQEKKQLGSLFQKFCTSGTHIDCRQVTKSAYSKLFGLISWAEIGMAWFSAITIWVAISPLNANWIAPMWWLFLVPLPFTLWSLFTQAFLIRKWCLFCCATVLLLWINFGILYFFFPHVQFLPVVESLLLVLLILACFAAVMYICKSTEVVSKYFEQRELAKIKYDIKTLHSQLSEFQYKTQNTGFIWGGTQSSHEITLLISIACAHCGAAVKEVRNLISIYPDFSYRLIFAVTTDDYEHKSNIIIRHFLCLYKKMDMKGFFDMLDAWYFKLNKNIEELQKAFPLSIIQYNNDEMDKLYQFRQLSKISYTPAILINGRLLSQLYSYQDLYAIARTLYSNE